ncbi:uncharacterized protein LOC118320024 [Scophthalmus maximus]|uniref:uncharacterized protein LOC118320024 n=1 Tax=Scophthalmus maximus TaxID=52904 RepID=UPI001FA8DB58|nr:uncharacterized protein LOC118320024 [Scophthalmus maximus]
MCACVDQVEQSVDVVDDGKPLCPGIREFVKELLGQGEKREEAAALLYGLQKALSDESRTYESLDELFKEFHIDQAQFEAAYKLVGRKKHIVLKREVNEIWVNQYNKELLKCWNANMDIQYDVDAYACVVYIISYISKSEREMGLLLGNAKREAAKEGNVSAKEALKSLGSVYLHNRDVCAQEAVYRLSNMHLKECSRAVVFIPTGDNIVKMSLPLRELRQKAASRDLTTEDMWMTSLVDRYKSRPEDGTFNDMCIATFASEYRVLSKSENCKNAIKLGNGCGFVTKRTRTQPAVVRYARFSEDKYPEAFCKSILQLFLPYRVDEQLRPPSFEKFQQFYENGHVRLSDGSMHSVKDVVDVNRGLFEIEADELDKIEDIIDSEGLFEDAWCELCPEKELERLECEEELKDREPVEQHEVDPPGEGNVPDLAAIGEPVAQVANLEKKNNG